MDAMHMKAEALTRTGIRLYLGTPEAAILAIWLAALTSAFLVLNEPIMIAAGINALAIMSIAIWYASNGSPLIVTDSGAFMIILLSGSLYLSQLSAAYTIQHLLQPGF